MTRKLIAGFAAALMIVGVGAAFAYDAAGEKNALAAIAEFKTADPSLDAFFKDAYGYAIFPEITKGAVGIGGAAGDGTVFQGGEVIGSSTMSQVTIGLRSAARSIARRSSSRTRRRSTISRMAISSLPPKHRRSRSRPERRRTPAMIRASPSSPWRRAA